MASPPGHNEAPPLHDVAAALNEALLPIASGSLAGALADPAGSDARASAIPAPIPTEPTTAHSTASNGPVPSTTTNNTAPAPPETATARLLASSLLQNPNKAGTALRSRDEINAIIHEVSKNSAYSKKLHEKAEKLNAEIDLLKAKAARFSQQDLDASALAVNAIVAARVPTRDLSRVIVHVDMDAFFASVEELERPDLKGKPMAVGGPKNGGTLATANYEARKYGVRSAMATYIATKLCPELVILKPSFEKYKYRSDLVRTVFAKYHEKYTPASLDEAYLDITEYLQQHPELTPETLVNQMRTEIFEASELTASAGIACNRMIAKICSDFNKPNGQHLVPSTPKAILEFMKPLPIRKIPGIGNVSDQILKAFGVETCGDLVRPNLFDHCVDISLGIGSIEVNRNDDAIPKGMGREQTAIMKKPEQMFDELEKLAQQLETDLAESGLVAKCVNLKLKDEKFTSFTRAKTMPGYLSTWEDMFNIAQEMLVKELEANPALTLRLIGLRMSTIVKKSDLEVNKNMFVIEPTDPDPTAAADTQQPAPKRLQPIPEIRTQDCPICYSSIEIQMLPTHVTLCLQKLDAAPASRPHASFSSSSAAAPASKKSKLKASSLTAQSPPPKYTLFAPQPPPTRTTTNPLRPTLHTPAPMHHHTTSAMIEDDTIGPRPCPICGILLASVAMADKHIGICFVKKNHPEMEEEWKEYVKMEEAAGASSHVDVRGGEVAGGPSTALRGVGQSRIGETWSARCENCGFNLDLLSPENAVAHVQHCGRNRQQQPRKKPVSVSEWASQSGGGVANGGGGGSGSGGHRMGGKINHAVSPVGKGKGKEVAQGGFGIGKYLVHVDAQGDEKGKRKREEVDGEEVDVYISSQGAKYETEYGACFICHKMVPVAFMNEHVETHLDE
ncbi:hypothetical protein HDU98_011538 [Podochytrium sp. JEL0797]|nr:hypothetical protein HDU98_011538 [Podochytrium sp. JEL0797]